jgi:hypothetical protein
MPRTAKVFDLSKFRRSFPKSDASKTVPNKIPKEAHAAILHLHNVEGVPQAMLARAFKVTPPAIGALIRKYR